MFAIACPRHGCRVLVPVSRIVDLESGRDGIAARVRCWCGEVVEWHARGPVPA